MTQRSSRSSEKGRADSEIQTLSFLGFFNSSMGKVKAEKNVAAASKFVQKSTILKSKKGKKILADRESKIIENPKNCIFLRGKKVSQEVKSLLVDFLAMKKPLGKIFNRVRDTIPFEDQSEIEYLCEKNDSSLFVFGSKTKKRPHNLILGRCFNWQVLDMFELFVNPDTFKSMQDIRKEVQPTRGAALGSKPLILFNGEAFETKKDYIKLKNFFIDFFRGIVTDEINLIGIDHVIMFSSHNEEIFMRHYSVTLKKSGTKIPNLGLEEIGPRVDFKLSRAVGAAEDVQNDALKVPRELQAMKKTTKNITKGSLGRTLGRVHMKKQDLSTMALRRFKGRGSK